jgi:hypothetical protein
MHLPRAIQIFFDADHHNDSPDLLGAFTQDAVVQDEGRAHHGHAAIDAWWRDAKAKYDPRAVPVARDDQDGTVRVRATVTGNFPTSPVTLTYGFTLAGERIARLEITA